MMLIFIIYCVIYFFMNVNYLLRRNNDSSSDNDPLTFLFADEQATPVSHPSSKHKSQEGCQHGDAQLVH